MTGLLLKDLYTLRRQGKVILMVAVFYLIFGLAANNLSMFGTIVVLLSAMAPITTMSYDEYNKWDKYVLSMPVSRQSVVLSKYALGITFSVGAAIVLLLANALVRHSDFKLALLSVIGFTAAANLFLAIVLPLLFKFGVEKGRILMIITLAIPTLLVMLFANLGFQLPSEQTVSILAYSAPLFVIIAMFLSMRVSIWIYNRKQF